MCRSRLHQHYNFELLDFRRPWLDFQKVRYRGRQRVVDLLQEWFIIYTLVKARRLLDKVMPVRRIDLPSVSICGDGLVGSMVVAHVIQNLKGELFVKLINNQ